MRFLRRWLGRDPLIDDLITPPRPTHSKVSTPEYESILATAERRRQAAEEKRRQAARIQSGQPVAERLRLVGQKGKA
jgi:hypothetical protein